MKTAMVVAALVMTQLLQPLPAGAKPVYKCEEGGTITFTDQPCGPGASAAALPEPVITAPLTQAEQDLARANEARLARERAERDREDARWLKEHAKAKERAESGGKKKERKR